MLTVPVGRGLWGPERGWHLPRHHPTFKFVTPVVTKLVGFFHKNLFLIKFTLQEIGDSHDDSRTCTEGSNVPFAHLPSTAMSHQGTDVDTARRRPWELLSSGRVHSRVRLSCRVSLGAWFCRGPWSTAVLAASR